MDFTLREMGLDNSMISALHDMFELIDEPDVKQQHPSRAFIRDTKAMKATPADIIEYPNAYKFLIDMPGLKSDQIKVQLEDGNTLVVSGERRREKDKEKEDGVMYLKMERRFGKFLKKFVLPENANNDEISAVCQDGVLVVTVEKQPPPEPTKPKVIEVKVGGPHQDEAIHELDTSDGSHVAKTEY